MDTKSKVILTVLAIVALGGYFFPGSSVQLVQPLNQYTQTVGSAVGSTFGTAKIASINFSPSVGATSTSMINSDASDRYVTSSFYYCSGLGVSKAAYTYTSLTSNGLIFLAATSSTASTPINANTNFVMYNTISTSTIYDFTASTTVYQAADRIWKAGSYLNFWSNATNTATCTVGVHYLGS